jgi:hypothetical protein
MLCSKTGMKACVVLIDGAKVQTYFTSPDLELKIKPNLDKLLELNVEMVAQDKAVGCDLITNKKLKLFKKGVRTIIEREEADINSPGRSILN